MHCTKMENMCKTHKTLSGFAIWRMKANDTSSFLFARDEKVWHVYIRYDTIRDAILTCARKST